MHLHKPCGIKEQEITPENLLSGKSGYVVHGMFHDNRFQLVLDICQIHAKLHCRMKNRRQLNELATNRAFKAQRGYA
jgi:hypothetical protein